MLRGNKRIKVGKSFVMGGACAFFQYFSIVIVTVSAVFFLAAASYAKQHPDNDIYNSNSST